MPKDYGYGVKPTSSGGHKMSKGKSYKKPKKRKAVKTVMSHARSKMGSY